jgi:WD40 repeat protein
VVEHRTPGREAVPARPGSDVFISYSRRDREVVERLASALESRGRTAWVDWADIPPTAEWMTEIKAAIDASDTIVVVLSPDSVASPVCSEELEAASAANKRIVPVVVREVTSAEVPPELSKRNWLFLRETDDFEAGVDTLVTALETDLEATRFHTGLLVKAREWEGAGEPKSRLLRGSDLTEAEGYVASPGKGPAPTQEQTSFVLASRKAATRRQRGAIAIATCVALVAATMGLFAWNQRGTAIEQRQRAEDEADDSLSRQLVVQSSALLEDQLDLGLLLSIEAYHASQTDEARIALLRSAWQTRLLKASLRASPGRTYLALSPNGRTLASGGTDGLILWDVETGELVDRFAYSKDLRGIAFSPDGKTIAAGSRGVVALWDATTGELVRELPYPNWVVRVAFTPNGSSLAAGDNSGRVILWDPVTGHRISLLGDGPGQIVSLAISPDGRTIAAGDNWRTVRMWALPSGRQTASLRASDWWVLDLAFSPDSSMLAIATYDGTISIRDAATGRRMKEMGIRSDGYATSVAFSPDAQTLASATNTGVVFIWDQESGRRIQTLDQTAFVRDLVFSQDGSILASVSDDGVTLLHRLDDRRVSDPGRARVWTNSLAYSQDGKRVAWGGWPPHISTWDVGLERSVAVAIDAESYRWVNSVTFSPDGRILAAGMRGSKEAPTLLLWDTATGRRLPEPLFHEQVTSVVFSPDGQTLATALSKGNVLLWEVSTWRKVGVLANDAWVERSPRAQQTDRSYFGISTRRRVAASCWRDRSQ